VKFDQYKIDRSSWDEIHIDGWFRALIPPNWEVEDDEQVVVFDPSGFGEMTISLFNNAGRNSKKEKAANMISDWAEELGLLNTCEVSIFKRTRDLLIASAECVSDEPEGEIVYWRIFPVIGGRITLDISYSCPLEDRDREEMVVEAIVDSIELIETGSGTRIPRRRRKTAGE
jgi:hypothetical protein